MTTENEFVIDTTEITFKDQNDNTLVKGSLLDIHYLTATTSSEGKEAGKTQQEIYTEIAGEFEKHFQKDENIRTPISWQIALKISMTVQARVDEEKKS
jgi:hypothetical protein